MQVVFDVNPYPSSEKLDQLENELEDLSRNQIAEWFKHQRKKRPAQ